TVCITPQGEIQWPMEGALRATGLGLTPPDQGVSLTGTGGCNGAARVRALGGDRSRRGEPVAPGVHAHGPGPRSRRVPARSALRNAAGSAHPYGAGRALVALGSHHLAPHAPRSRGGAASGGGGRGAGEWAGLAVDAGEGLGGCGGRGALPAPEGARRGAAAAGGPLKARGGRRPPPPAQRRGAGAGGGAAAAKRKAA